jgi:hypothetical protein
LRKMKLIWLTIAGILLFFSLTWAAPPQNYTLTYAFKDQDQKVVMMVKCYLLDSTKLRVDSFVDNVVTTIVIYRKDKGQVWTFYPNIKQYTEIPMEQTLWDQAIKGTSNIPLDSSLKTGETKLLNYNCDIYEMKKDGKTDISFIVKGMNVILKSQSIENDKILMTAEATEFHLGNPAALLFEILAGYKKI